jgi:hypothetical protein
MKLSHEYMKGAEFKARQGWLPFVDAAGIMLEVLEPIKATAWEWFKQWKKAFRTPKAKQPVNKGLELLDLVYGLPWASQPRLI